MRKPYNYDRLTTLSIEEGLRLIRNAHESIERSVREELTLEEAPSWMVRMIRNRAEKNFCCATIQGFKCSVYSLRLLTFLTYGIKCSVSTCHLQGAFFAVERTKTKKPSNIVRYHLNLWAVNEAGYEVLMTHDHTVSRGTGGADSIQNTTTMCDNHNSIKSKTENIK